MLNRFARSFVRPGWSRLVGVNSKKEGNFEVYLLMNGEQIGGLAVLHTDHRELTVVNIVGPVDLDKLAELEGQLGIPDLGDPTVKTEDKERREVRSSMKTFLANSSIC